jgi:coenzyme F420-reducing hydrogenase delta subunit/heterodisulfide reductase subunit C
MAADRVDGSFREEVLAEPGGEHLERCYARGACASMCLVRRVDPDFNPRMVLHMVMQDMQEEVLSSPVVWLCSACDLCHTVCPQQIHISELMTAIRNIAIREGWEPPGPMEGNGNGHVVAQVDRFLCMGCGTCAAACPAEAMRVEGNGRDQVTARIQAAGSFIAREIEPKIVVFICDWCLRVEEDLALLERLPPHVRAVRVPYTGQLDPSLVLAAFTKGADGVLVLGCRPGECHYQRGNLLARRRITEMRPFLDVIGIGSERPMLRWIPTFERGVVGRAVRAYSELVEQLGPSPLNRPRSQTSSPAATQYSLGGHISDGA